MSLQRRFRLRPVVLTGALLAAAFAATIPVARAQTCTWGTPGYRDCVDEKIRRQKESEAKGGPRLSFPTAPAAQRAPQLTPLGPGDIQVLAPPTRAQQPSNKVMRENQRNLDNNLMGINRDRGLQPILPPLRNPVPPMPGQICPSQGC